MKNQEKSALIPLIRKDLRENYTPYSSAASEMGKQEGMLYLNANENPYPFKGLEGLESYDVQQPPAMIEAMANAYKTKPENIVATRGSDESIDLLLRMFCEAGKDAILTCPPTFSMYGVYGKLQGAKNIEIPLIERNGHFSLDTEQVIATAKDPNQHVKLVFICSPNSPTGENFDIPTIKKIASELEGHAAVVVDEAYIDFSGWISFVEELPNHPNMIVLRTLSKIHALAGERIGGTVCEDKGFTNFMRGCLAPYPIPKSVAVNATEALQQAEGKQDSMIQKITASRKELFAAFAKGSIVERVYPSNTNFLLVKFVSYEKAQEFLKRALHHRIVLRDVSSNPETKNCLRISVGPDTANNTLQLLISDVRQIDTRHRILNQRFKELKDNGSGGYLLYCMDLFDYHDDDGGIYFVHCKTKNELHEKLSGYYLGLDFQQANDCCLYVIDINEVDGNLSEDDLQYAELWPMD